MTSRLQAISAGEGLWRPTSPNGTAARARDRETPRTRLHGIPIGVKDVNYIGNVAVSKYEVPQEAIDYAFNRSPFRIV